MLKFINLLLLVLLLNGCTTSSFNNFKSNVKKSLTISTYKYTYHKNGMTQWKYQYIYGKLDGKQIRYSNNGRVEIVEIYKDGKLLKVSIYGNGEDISWKQENNKKLQNNIIKKEIEYNMDDI